MRTRVAIVASLLTVSTVLSFGSVAGARVRVAPDVPPSDQDTLARLFDPELRRLGLRTTRAALQDPDGYERTSTGTHLAIYVEPIAKGEVDRAVYTRNIMKVARIYLPYVFRRWSDLKSFDVCQEPEPALDPRPAPAPVTQLVATRKGAAALDWEHASLATLIERAHTIKGRHGATDPLSLYVSPRVLVEPLYQQALRRADLPKSTSPTAPADAG